MTSKKPYDPFKCVCKDLHKVYLDIHVNDFYSVLYINLNIN